jgi:hypothetical protein
MPTGLLLPNDPLLTVDEGEPARMRASVPALDVRQAANLEGTLDNMQSGLREAETSLAGVSRNVVELCGNLRKAESAQKKLAKVGGIPAAMGQKIEKLRDALRDEQKRESRLTAIVKGRKEGIERFLAEGPKDAPSNGEMIVAARERDNALASAGL